MANNVMQNQHRQYPMNNFQQQQNYRPNNQHHQGRNDYNMFNQNQQYPSNFQGQNYRENMQSNNMPYDQVMNTVSMMKFMKEFMDRKYNTMDHAAPRSTYGNNQDYSMEFMRRMNNQNMQSMRFKRQVNGNTKPHGSDANNLPGFLELGDRLAEK